MNQTQKIKCVIRWATSDDAPEDFNTDFLESLEKNCQHYGSLTDNQEAALDNIIDRFKIDVALYR